MPKALNVHQLREIERMEEYQKPNPHPASPTMIRMVNVLFAALVILMIVMLAIKAYAAPEDHDLCRAVTNASISLSGRPAEWIGYPEGWKDMPADLWDTPIDLLYTDSTMEQGYFLQFSPSKQELWVFPLWSFDVTTDANGNYAGTHDLCQVMIYSLNPKDR